MVLLKAGLPGAVSELPMDAIERRGRVTTLKQHVPLLILLLFAHGCATISGRLRQQTSGQGNESGNKGPGTTYEPGNTSTYSLEEASDVSSYTISKEAAMDFLLPTRSHVPPPLGLAPVQASLSLKTINQISEHKTQALASSEASQETSTLPEIIKQYHIQEMACCKKELDLFDNYNPTERTWAGLLRAQFQLQDEEVTTLETQMAAAWLKQLGHMLMQCYNLDRLSDLLGEKNSPLYQEVRQLQSAEAVQATSSTRDMARWLVDRGQVVCGMCVYCSSLQAHLKALIPDHFTPNIVTALAPQMKKLVHAQIRLQVFKLKRLQKLKRIEDKRSAQIEWGGSWRQKRRKHITKDTMPAYKRKFFIIENEFLQVTLDLWRTVWNQTPTAQWEFLKADGFEARSVRRYLKVNHDCNGKPL